MKKYLNNRAFVGTCLFAAISIICSITLILFSIPDKDYTEMLGWLSVIIGDVTILSMVAIDIKEELN